MRCLPMRQQQSCCRHAAQPYIPLWGPYIPSIDRKWMFRQIGSGYHYCQLVHGPLANFPHTKNSVLAVTTRRLELGLAAVLCCPPIAVFSPLFSHCYALLSLLCSYCSTLVTAHSLPCSHVMLVLSHCCTLVTAFSLLLSLHSH